MSERKEEEKGAPVSSEEETERKIEEIKRELEQKH